MSEGSAAVPAFSAPPARRLSCPRFSFSTIPPTTHREDGARGRRGRARDRHECRYQAGTRAGADRSREGLAQYSGFRRVGGCATLPDPGASCQAIASGLGEVTRPVQRVPSKRFCELSSFLFEPAETATRFCAVPPGPLEDRKQARPSQRKVVQDGVRFSRDCGRAKEATT